MLLLLSKWLSELNSASDISEEDRREMQSLTRMSLGTWVQLQAAAVQVAKDLKEAQEKEKEAIAALTKKSAVRHSDENVCGFGVEDADQGVSEQLMGCSKTLRNLVCEAQAKRRRQADFGEVFFRDCLKHCHQLASTKALGREAGAILSRMSKETNALWVRQTKQHTDEIDQLAGLIAGLRESYKDKLGSSATRNSHEFTER